MSPNADGDAPRVSFDQNVPLGPVDRRQATRRHWLRRRRPPRPPLLDPVLALGLVGVLLAAGGVWLGAGTPRVQVSVTARAYSVGGQRLPARGGGVYQGTAGVVVLRDQGSVLQGAASSTDAGRPMTGRCEGAGLHETCHFQVGARVLRAVDTWSGGAWSRLYGGGRRVQLVVAQGHPVPVPIPVDAPL